MPTLEGIKNKMDIRELKTTITKKERAQWMDLTEEWKERRKESVNLKIQ